MKSSIPASLWAEVKAAYQRGEGSCSVLSKRFGIRHTTLQRRITNEKWRAEKKEVLCKVSEEVAREIYKPTVDLYEKLVKGFQKDLEIIETSYDQAANMLEPVDVRHLVSARKMIADGLADLGVIQRAPEKVEHSGEIKTVPDELREHLIKLRQELAKDKEQPVNRLNFS